MARRNRKSHGQFADTDVQMMETDIMRFLAIIALCLAIIFAIVSGAGTVKEKKQQQENTTVTQIVSQATPDKTIEQNPEPKKEPKKETKLAEIVKPQQLEQTAKIESAVEIKEEVKGPAEKVEAPIKAELSQKKGYQLTFASDSVFSQLINQQYVKLYKFSHGVNYRWNDGWKIDNKPKKYYQLHVETLPTNYQQQVLTDDEIGVVLPVNTQTEIQQVISQYESGLLVIGHMAKVSRKPLS